MIGKEETEARILRIARIHGAVVSGPNRGEAYGSMIRVHHATLASMARRGLLRVDGVDPETGCPRYVVACSA